MQDEAMTAHIYIDTNVILSFYQAGDERLDTFKALHERANILVFPEQTISEVRRNREALLSRLRRDVEKSLAVKPHATALVRDLDEFGAVKAACDSLHTAGKAMMLRLESMQRNAAIDVVWAAFEKIASADGVVRIQTTPRLVEAAKDRKAMGAPPSSPDKYTVGDELIWESLLAAHLGDLIIVSRDHGFLDHAETLRRVCRARGRQARRRREVGGRPRESWQAIAGDRRDRRRTRSVPAM